MPFPILGIVLIVRRVENFLSKYFSALFFCLQAQLRTISAGPDPTRQHLRPGVSTNNCAYSFPGKNLPGKKLQNLNLIKHKKNRSQIILTPIKPDPRCGESFTPFLSTKLIFRLLLSPYRSKLFLSSLEKFLCLHTSQ